MVLKAHSSWYLIHCCPMRSGNSKDTGEEGLELHPVSWANARPTCPPLLLWLKTKIFV